MKLDNIDFDNIDWSKYQDQMDEINKLCDELMQSKNIQRIFKMQQIRENLGLEDDRKLRKINYIRQEKGCVEEDMIELVFKDGTRSYVLVSEIIKLYNYEKGKI